LDHQTRAQVINCLIEACSIRATVRVTGVAKKTIMRLLVEVGDVCANHQDQVFRNLRAQRVQVDELWSWSYCKDKNPTAEFAAKHPDAGDAQACYVLDVRRQISKGGQTVHY
jgi:hypothetical protein